MGWLSNPRFRLAVELSLLLHLLLLALPNPSAGVRKALALQAQQLPPPGSEPIRFELVELPHQQEEPPSHPQAPASNLWRRAHGGEGASAKRPGVAGNTPELRLQPPNASNSAPVAPEAAPAPSPAHDLPKPPQPPEGTASAVLQPERKRPHNPSPPLLKGLSPLTSQGLGAFQAPDRQGGQVDLGPLSFDTQWYDWGPYAAEMLRRIRYHWLQLMPEIARWGVPGVVRIRFLIEKNGKVSQLTIQKESGHPSMDFAARDAILNASPLPPLPAEVGVEREGVVITFYYNVRPPQEDNGG